MKHISTWHGYVNLQGWSRGTFPRYPRWGLDLPSNSTSSPVGAASFAGWNVATETTPDRPMKQMKAMGCRLFAEILWKFWCVTNLVDTQTNTLQIFFRWHCSMDLLREGTAERQFDGMEAAALKKFLGIVMCWLWCFFCDESPPSSL